MLTSKMVIQLIFFIFGTLLLTQSTHASHKPEECVISINDQFPDHEPVLISNKSHGYDFVHPENGFVRFQQNEEVVFLCSDRLNAVKLTNENSTAGICDKGTKFYIPMNKQYQQFDNLSCRNQMRGNIHRTRERCANGLGEYVDSGFQVTTQTFLPLIRSCLHVKRGEMFYSEHILYGKGLTCPGKKGKHPDFLNRGMTHLFIKEAYYNQLPILEGLVGPKHAKKYVNKHSILERGQLAPEGDFSFRSWQSVTYFYVNVVPQWHKIKNGNWLNVERTVRNVAKKNAATYIIYTGTHDVLSLPTDRGVPSEIYLIPEWKSVPVPKYLWKIVYNKETREAIALVILNDPFLKTITEDLLLCHNVCERYGWIDPSWSNVNKGYVYCCQVDDLRRTVRTIPDFEVVSVLKGW